MNHACVVAALLLCSSCSNEKVVDNGASDVKADDLNNRFDWSKEKFNDIYGDAARGNIDAAHNIWGYYMAHNDKENMMKWESFLIDKGNLDVIGYRISVISLQLKRLKDRDPRKIQYLKLLNSLHKYQALNNKNAH